MRPAPPVEGALPVHLAGVDVVLSSGFTPFLDFAKAHLAPISGEIASTPQIETELVWHEGAPPQRTADVRLAAMQRVDRDLYVDSDRLAWFRIDDCPDLHLRIEHDGRRLRVRGDYYHRLSKTWARDRAKRLLYRRALPALRRRRFTTLLYYLVYYPCFWWLERMRDWHPIHAGGVEIDGGVVVFAGPSGVGKSTLVAGLAGMPGAIPLSDTFLLHRGANVRPVPEPFLLDAWSRRWLGEPATTLRPIEHRYCLGRQGYHWGTRLSAGGSVRVVIFPHRAPRHFVRRLGADQAQGRIRTGDLIVNDLRRYWAFASVLELLGPTPPLLPAREQSLAALVGSVPSFEVGITSEVTLSDVMAVTNGLVSGARAA